MTDDTDSKPPPRHQSKTAKERAAIAAWQKYKAANDNWVEKTYDLAVRLSLLRDDFPNDQEFSRRLAEIGLGDIPANDRAALVGIGRHPDLALETLQNTEWRSLRRIWKNMAKKVKEVSQPCETSDLQTAGADGETTAAGEGGEAPEKKERKPRKRRIDMATGEEVENLVARQEEAIKRQEELLDTIETLIGHRLDLSSETGIGDAANWVYLALMPRFGHEAVNRFFQAGAEIPDPGPQPAKKNGALEAASPAGP